MLGVKRVASACALSLASSILVACGSASTAGDNTAGAWTTAEAGQMYLQMIVAPNVAVNAVGPTALAGNATTTANACAAASNSVGTLLHALATSPWPASVRGSISAVESKASTVRNDLEACVQDRSDQSALRADLDRLAKDSRTEQSAADAAGAELGLPRH